MKHQPKPCPECGAVHAHRFTLELEAERGELAIVLDASNLYNIEVYELPPNIRKELGLLLARLHSILVKVPKEVLEDLTPEAIQALVVGHAGLAWTEGDAPAPTSPGGSC